jgi:hypothetical protein
MSTSSFAVQETKIYRFSRLYQVYHFGFGAAALVAAVWWIDFWVLAIGLVPLAAFMIARPFLMKVIVDHDYVTLKGMYAEDSLERSSITAVETKLSGKSGYLILWGNLDEKECLMIPDIFGFDDDSDDWWGTYRDLSDSKPLSLF